MLSSKAELKRLLLLVDRVNRETHYGDHPSDNVLDAHVAGRLPPAADERVVSHIDYCVPCSEFVEDLTESESNVSVDSASRPGVQPVSGPHTAESPSYALGFVVRRLFGPAFDVVSSYSTSMWAAKRATIALAATAEVRLTADLDDYLGGSLTMKIESNLDATVHGDFLEPHKLFACLLNLSRGGALVRLSSSRDSQPDLLLDIPRGETRVLMLESDDLDLDKDELVLIVLTKNSKIH